MVYEKIIQPPLILVFGRRGIGKSYLCASLARSWPVQHVWVFDLAGNSCFSVFPQFDLDNPPPLRNSLLVFDEFSLVCGPRTWAKSWIGDVVMRGRHLNVGLIGNVQRAQDIHKSTHSLFTRVYIGHTTSRDDLDYLARAFGPEAYQAADLAPRQFVEIIA